VPEIGHGYSGDRYPATIGAVDFSLLERFHGFDGELEESGNTV
jgi:hypothetical protein